MGMGMNHWEWEGMGLKKTCPLTSTPADHEHAYYVTTRHNSDCQREFGETVSDAGVDRDTFRQHFKTSMFAYSASEVSRLCAIEIYVYNIHLVNHVRLDATDKVPPTTNYRKLSSSSDRM